MTVKTPQKYVNFTGYRFVSLAATALPGWREKLLAQAKALALKGTILLSTEGVNVFLAGTRAAADAYQAFLQQCDPFQDLWFKESFSEEQPFTRLLVRIKEEIISMGRPEIEPAKQTVPHLDPEEFESWYKSNKDMVVLDTRNDYEVALGTFEKAVDLNIESFRDFPNAVSLLPEAMKDKPVVTFCTGGVRCEKAGEYLKRQGFTEVYQLNGGIINYFERCGGAHYDGECFVFDKRVAVNTDLQETETQQCYACRHPITVEEQTSEGVCPHCQHHVGGKRYEEQLRQQRHREQSQNK